MLTTLVDLLQESAELSPGAIALLWRDAAWRYAELAEAMQAVAAYLSGCAVRPGERIGLLFRNCPQYVAFYYGALAAGCVVVPLNSHERARPLARQLEHSGASMVFGDSAHPEWSALSAELPANTVPIGIPIEGDDMQPAAFCRRVRSMPAVALAERRDASEPGGDALACILYTSGTTGQPKGVMLSHGNLVANMRSIVSYLGIKADDRVLCVLPFHFSYGNSVLHTHLIVGACVVIEDNFAFPHVILERMQAMRVTGFSGVPSTFALLLARTRLDSFDLSSLRYVTQAGGAMPRPTLRKLCEQLPHARVFVMYGQTEATARLTYLPPDQLENKFGSVGVGIPGVEIRVVGPAGEELAPGESGEICARGASIMLGYWRDEAMTASVLKDGWLSTGDIGRKDADGYLFIDGRSREMIKVGAFRVSPQEIEEVLAEIPGVQEAAVTHVADPLLGQAVKAVIVRNNEDFPDALAVRAHCRARLAAYKVPKEIEFAKSLPRTSSGKVQRFKLV